MRTSAPLFVPNITTEQKIELTRYLLSAVPNDFWICRLYEPQLIMRMERSNNRIERTEYVRIHLQQNADHLRSLKPSVRQNLRTAYNRLKRDGVEWHIETFLNSKNPMDDKMWNKLMTVYLSRLFGKYKRRNPVRQAYREFIYKHVKHDTKSLHSLPNGFHALLLEGDNVMGFLSSLISHDHSQLVVPRLAINAEYRFYSQGYILLSELIKRLTACTPCRILDLSRGNERYKLDMGGEIYHTLNLKRTELCMEFGGTPKEYLQ